MPDFHYKSAGCLPNLLTHKNQNNQTNKQFSWPFTKPTQTERSEPPIRKYHCHSCCVLPPREQGHIMTRALNSTISSFQRGHKQRAQAQRFSKYCTMAKAATLFRVCPVLRTQAHAHTKKHPQKQKKRSLKLTPPHPKSFSFGNPGSL